MTSENCRTSQKEILVVDDNADSRRLLSIILGNHGYGVRTASNGRLALESVAAGLPDLILLDVKMPDMDGYEVCRRLQADAQSRDVPVIFISSLAETAERVEGFEAGGVDYISKPFEAEEILARVKTHLRLHELNEQLEQKISERTEELLLANRRLQEEIGERKRMELALRASERQFRTLLEHLPVYVVRYDPQLRRTYVNPAWEQATGLVAEKVVGVEAAKVPQPTNKAYLEKLHQAFATGRPQFCEFEWENASGERLFLVYELTPEFGEDGKVASVLAVGQDLTGRKKAEDALKHERSLLRCIIDSASDLIFVKDANSRYRVCNKASEAFIGLPEAEQIGKSDFDFFPAEMARQVQENDRQVIEQGLTRQDEEWVTYPDGHKVLLDSLKVPFVGPEGKIEGLVGIARDITERKQAEEKILHSEQRLRLHRELSPLGFLEWDENFRAIEWNSACEQIFGYTREEAIGRHAKDLILPAEAHDLVDEIYQRLMNQSGGQHSINENVTKDGRIIICEWFNTTLVDKDGKAIGVASICNDITEQKQMEDALRVKREQLAAMTTELSLAEERERLRIAAVLHDHIGQLLLLSRIKLGTLTETEVSATARATIDETRELLDQATRDTHSLTVQLKPPVLGVAGLEAALEWLGKQMESDFGLKVEVIDDQRPKPLSEELCTVMYQCGRELLINVAKHAETDQAWLFVERSNNMYLLKIEDRGLGFDPAIVGSGAEKEWRFGLFSIQIRVERLGGQMLIDSAPGHGSRIEIRLPLTERETNQGVSHEH